MRQEGTMVDAKEYFSRATKLDETINSKLQQVAVLRDLALKTTSVLQTDKIQGTKQRSPMENALVKLMSLEEEINTDIDNLVDLKRELASFVARIDNPSYRLLLELRYLSGRTWDEVAAMMGYEVSWIYRLHKKALKEANRILADTTIEYI